MTPPSQSERARRGDEELYKCGSCRRPIKRRHGYLKIGAEAAKHYNCQFSRAQDLELVLADTIRVLDWATGEGQDNPEMPTVVNAYLEHAREHLPEETA